MASKSNKYETYSSANGAKTTVRKGSDKHKKIEKTRESMKKKLDKDGNPFSNSLSRGAAANYHTDKLKKNSKKK